MKEIKSNKGVIIKVDDVDFEWLNQYSWHITRAGYARTKINYKQVTMHALLLPNTNGLLRDHIDRDKLNNQKSNLRLLTNSENCRNRSLRNTGTSKYKGVSKHSALFKKKGLVVTWIVSIMVNGIRHPTKTFKTEIEAALHYNKLAKKLHGKFAVLNKI